MNTFSFIFFLLGLAFFALGISFFGIAARIRRKIHEDCGFPEREIN
jgi:hypothetical protein